MIRGPEGPIKYIIDAYFNPDLDFNMLSTTKMLQDMGIWWSSKDLILRSTDDDRVVGWTYVYCGVPRITISPRDVVLAATDDREATTETLLASEAMLVHRRMGHAGIPKMRKTLGVKIEAFNCDVCRESKAKRQVSRQRQNALSLDQHDPAALWYVDVQKISPKGHDGAVMYIIAINAATRLTAAIPIKEKKNAADRMIEFTKQIKLQTGQYPREFTLDNGKEFFHFREWGKKQGIGFKPTPPRTPEPNGPSERFGGYLNEIARCALIDAGLPKTLWPLAVENAAYTINRLHQPNNKDPRPPIQKWREHWKIQDPLASAAHLKVFGCRAWVHIPKEDRTTSQKMEPRAQLGYYVGTEGDHGHVWRIWIPKSRKVVRSRDVTFDESRVYKDDYDADGIAIENPDETPIPVVPGQAAHISVRQPERQPAPEPQPDPAPQTTPNGREAPNEHVQMTPLDTTTRPREPVTPETPTATARAGLSADRRAFRQGVGEGRAAGARAPASDAGMAGHHLARPAWLARCNDSALAPASAAGSAGRLASFAALAAPCL